MEMSRLRVVNLLKLQLSRNISSTEVTEHFPPYFIELFSGGSRMKRVDRIVAVLIRENCIHYDSCNFFQIEVLKLPMVFCR